MKRGAAFVAFGFDAYVDDDGMVAPGVGFDAWVGEVEMEGMEAVFSFGLPGACRDLADLEAPRGVLFGVASPRAPDADVDAGVGISGKSLSSVKSM